MLSCPKLIKYLEPPMIPSSAELTYFIEVASSLNLSHAAKKIGMSQPSLSLAIKRLEETVGASLFIRHKHGVSLTPAGKKLLSQAKPLLQLWEETKSQALAAHNEALGKIILGCHSIIAIFLHDFFGNLLEEHKNITVQLQHDFSQKITEGVMNSSIDIGIVVNPVQHPDLIIRKLNDSETTFWKGKGNREIQDIHSNNRVIICNPEIPQTHVLLKNYKMNARLVTSNSMEVIASLTVNGCGIGILPACFISSLYPGMLERIPDAPSCFDEIFLIYRNENRNIKIIDVVVEALKQFLSKKNSYSSLPSFS